MAASDHFSLFCNADGHCLGAIVKVFSYLKNVIYVASSQASYPICLIDCNTEIIINRTRSSCGPVWQEGALLPPSPPLSPK